MHSYLLSLKIIFTDIEDHESYYSALNLFHLQVSNKNMHIMLDCSVCYNVIGVVIALIIGIITFTKWKYGYWKRKNLPFLKPSFPFGTMENPFQRTKSLGLWIQQNYNDLKKHGNKHGGIYNFGAPNYLPIDPDYIKNIMQNDFQYFVDRGIYYNEKDDPLSAHLFTLGGQKWRNLRTKLTPTFTSGKMKMMFNTLVECSVPMKELMDKLTAERQKVDIKELVARYTTDIIGSCAFGLDCNSFESEDAQFRKCGKRLFQRTVFEQIRILLFFSRPSLGHFFKVRALSKTSTDFFLQIIKDTVNYREKNNIRRNDMLQLLIDMKGKEEDGSNKRDGASLSVEEIAAQALVFFAAGFETSSTTMTFCFFEVAKNLEIQQKLRDEINEVLPKHNNKITYESMTDLKYMSQVIDETLRKYPPVPQITRKCVKDYPVPDTDVVIEKGILTFISVYGVQHDPEFYPDPEIFDPERFSEENKKGRHPFTYLPFGEGPRLCIGMRFGLMQVKVGLTVLLKNYEFSLNRNTELPLKIDPYQIVLGSKSTIWLNSKALN